MLWGDELVYTTCERSQTSDCIYRTKSGLLIVGREVGLVRGEVITGTVSFEVVGFSVDRHGDGGFNRRS